MTLSVTTRSVVLIGTPNVPLSLTGGDLTLDEGWAPYAKGNIHISVPPQAILDRLDPRLNPRLLVTATVDYALNGVDLNPSPLLGSSRTFNLLIRKRPYRFGDGAVVIEVAGDEALLQDYALVATDPLVRPNTSGLTAIKSAISQALPGVVPTITAAIPTTVLTNLHPNPGGETNAAYWISGGGSSVAPSRQIAIRRTGTAAIQAVANGTGVMAVIIAVNATVSAALSATAGKTYTFSLFVRATGQWSVKLALRYYNAAGGAIGNDTFGATVLTPTADWRLMTVTATAPPGTVSMWPIFFTDGPMTGAGTFYFDDSMIIEGKEILPPFSGATTNTAEVVYSWAGTAHASPSTATVKGHVDYSATTWQPGVTAWDYLTPILTALGWRLFCDEKRIWRLVDSTYSVPGSIRVSTGHNLYDGSDDITRGGDSDWCDAVVVKYTWTDVFGVQQATVDTASMPGFTKVKTVELTTPYPGPGAAAYILARAQGKGRTLALTTALDYTAQPGMEVAATIDNIPNSTGYLSAVTFSLSDDHMEISSRGLTDTPANAWILAPTGRRWIDVAAGVTWNTYTN